MNKIDISTIQKNMLRCSLINLEQVYDLTWQLAKIIKASGYRPDIIIAIARGGFVPARFLCDFLHLADMTSIKVQHYKPGAQKQEKALVKFPLNTNIKGMNVLIADDVNDTGESLQVAVKHLNEFDPASVKIAVLHEKTTTTHPADYKGESVTEWAWIIYPWAMTEDLGTFIDDMNKEHPSENEVKQWLLDNYDLDVPDKIIRQILTSK